MGRREFYFSVCTLLSHPGATDESGPAMKAWYQGAKRGAPCPNCRGRANVAKAMAMISPCDQLCGHSVTAVWSLRRVHLSATPWTVGPPRLPCPWDAPGQNTGVDCHFLLRGIFPSPGIQPAASPVLAGKVLTPEPTWEAHHGLLTTTNPASCTARVSSFRGSPTYAGPGTPSPRRV